MMHRFIALLLWTVGCQAGVVGTGRSGDGGISNDGQVSDSQQGDTGLGDATDGGSGADEGGGDERGDPGAGDPIEPNVDNAEFTARGRLPNVFFEIGNNQHIKIAYLGGSITAASGWRVYSFNWFVDTFPQATFEEVYAAIGGTGSELGAFRLEQDVLRHNPDLVFVEFAVNDSGGSDSGIHRSMEGIVRQIWSHDSEIDIFFIYTLKESMLVDYQGGGMSASSRAMEAIAEHYDIPSLHFGVEIAELATNGDLIFTGTRPSQFPTIPIIFSGDGVHPFVESGHVIYFETLRRNLISIQNSHRRESHPLAAPFTANNLEDAKLAPITAAMRSGIWTDVTDSILVGNPPLPVLWSVPNAGDSLSCSFTGTFVGIYDVMGPSCGKIEVSIDGGAFTEHIRFDSYCSYYRRSSRAFSSSLSNTEHTLTIRVSGDPVDKQSILSVDRLDDYVNNPEKYAGNTWYPAALMIRGEVVE